MNDNSKTEDAGSKPPKSGPKGKGRRKSRDAAPKPAKHSVEPAPEFDFVGRVESLRVAGGAGAEVFEFGLRGRHGKRQRFRLDPASPFALNAMAHLVLAAHGTGAKIGIRAGDEVEGVIVVRELESRPRLGK